MMTGSACERRSGTDQKNEGYGTNARTKARVHVNLIIK
jgi:hypothetical protein